MHFLCSLGGVVFRVRPGCLKFYSLVVVDTQDYGAIAGLVWGGGERASCTCRREWLFLSTLQATRAQEALC